MQGRGQKSILKMHKNNHVQLCWGWVTSEYLAAYLLQTSYLLSRYLLSNFFFNLYLQSKPRSVRGEEVRAESRLLKLDSIVDIPTDEEDDTLRDLEAQPSLDPEPEAEQRDGQEEEDEDESFPLLNETSFLGPPQPQPGAGSKSLRRQYRCKENNEAANLYVNGITYQARF